MNDHRVVFMLDENNIDENAPSEWTTYEECVGFLREVPASLGKKLEKKGQSFDIQHESGRLVSWVL